MALHNSGKTSTDGRGHGLMQKYRAPYPNFFGFFTYLGNLNIAARAGSLKLISPSVFLFRHLLLNQSWLHKVHIFCYYFSFLLNPAFQDINIISATWSYTRTQYVRSDSYTGLTSSQLHPIGLVQNTLENEIAAPWYNALEWCALSTSSPMVGWPVCLDPDPSLIVFLQRIHYGESLLPVMFKWPATSTGRNYCVLH